MRHDDDDAVPRMTQNYQKTKVKVKVCIAVNGTPSHSYGVSLDIRDYTVNRISREQPVESIIQLNYYQFSLK